MPICLRINLALQDSMHLQATSAPDIDKLNEYQTTIAEKLSEYYLQDIYNCDETEPSKTLVQDPVIGTKKSKNRVTILLTCNTTDEDKLKPLFIHKYKNTRPLHGISVKDSVDYYWNKTAWILIRAQRKNILLLVDNALTYGKEDEIPSF
ncbi:16931_t:CDS:2, partial [Funneliformis geosporum]